MVRDLRTYTVDNNIEQHFNQQQHLQMEFSKFPPQSFPNWLLDHISRGIFFLAF